MYVNVHIYIYIYTHTHIHSSWNMTGCTQRGKMIREKMKAKPHVCLCVFKPSCIYACAYVDLDHT
jgi:hypothetical protein